MALTINDTAPDFEGRHDRGRDQVPRLDRRLVGGALLAPEGLHAGLHHRARLHGEDPARVRPAQREDHRALGRPHERPRGLGRRHRGDPGRAPNYPIIGDADFALSKLYGMLPADTSGDAKATHRGRQPDRAQRLRHRPRQEGQARPHLPDDDRPQLRRGAARHRLAPAHREAQGRDARQLEAGRRRHHRRLGLERRGEGDLPGGWKCPSRTSASSTSRSPNWPRADPESKPGWSVAATAIAKQSRFRDSRDRGFPGGNPRSARRTRVGGSFAGTAQLRGQAIACGERSRAGSP